MMKRIPFERFRRRYHCFKKTHYNRYIDMVNFKIPRASILHLSNGLNIVSDVEPDLEEIYKYIDSEGKIRLSYNTMLTPQWVGYEPPTEQFRSIPAGVNSRLTKFKTSNSSILKVRDTVEALVDDRPEIYSICHHSAIKAVRIVGRMKEQRFYQHLYGGIVDVMQRTPEGVPATYYPVYVKDFYNRTDFISLIRRGFEISTITRPEDPVYHLIGHLLLMSSGSDHPHAFTHIDQEHLRKIHFIFTNGTVGFIYSMYDLSQRLQGDAILIDRWLSQLAGLVNGQATIEDIEDTEDETDTEVVSETPVKKPIVLVHTPPPIPPKELSAAKPERPPTVRTKKSTTKPTEHIDKGTDEVLTELFKDPNVVRTDRQKDTLRDIATKYKTIEIDGRKIEDILNQSNGSDPVKKKDLSHLKDVVLDESFLASSLVNFNKQYITEHYEREIFQVACSYGTAGYFLTDVKKEVTKNDMEDFTVYTFQYYDKDLKKQKPVKVKLPNIQPDGTIKSRGAYKQIARQRMNVPICQVSESRVAICSDYIKAQIEWLPRQSKSLIGEVKKILKKYPEDLKYYSGRFVDPDNRYPVELAILAEQYKTIVAKDYTWTFQLKSLLYDKTTGMWKITTDDSKQQHFIDMNNRITVYENDQLVETSHYLKLLADQVGIATPDTHDYTTISLLSKDIPVGILLASRYGLIPMLDRLKIDYDIHYERVRDLTDDMVQLKLADCTIVFPKYPYEKSLVASGMCAFKLKDYLLEDLNDTDNYHSIFESNGIHPSYLKGAKNFFNLFMDPVTFGILESMGEPTTVSGLLVRATEMLATRDHEPSSSVNNFRSRAHGKIPAMLYHEMAKQMAVASSNTLKGDSISINPEAVFQRVLQDPLTTNVDVNNPTGALRDFTTFTYAGHGGRTEESFVVRDRIYPKNARGVVSEASVDSGSVGFRAYYSLDANIVNMYGMEEPVPDDQLNAHNLLSFSSCLIPGTMQDDPKRNMLTAAQTAQTIPVNGAEVSRVRTSYERVLPHMVGQPFTFVAEQDGKVVADDTKLQVLKIEYKDGTMVSLPYGDQIAKYSGIGLHTNQAVRKHSKLGKTFKANDVLTYNEQFFSEAPEGQQVIWKQGTPLIVAFMDKELTQEDSSYVSSEALSKLVFNPIHEKELILTTSNAIVEYADIGATVSPISSLLVFEEGEDVFSTDDGYDEETIAYIESLNRKTPKAGVTGEVVAIEVYYKSKKADMAPSMRRFIDKVEATRKAKAKFTKGTVGEVSEPHPLEYSDKVGYAALDTDTVIIKYYIRGTDVFSPGSKLSIHSALKTVPGSVLSYSPHTVDGKYHVDLMYARIGLFNRVIWSAILMGAGSLLCTELENQILTEAELK